MIRVALAGPRPEALLSAFPSSDFEVFLEPDAAPESIDVLVVLSDAPPFPLEPWRGVPAILVASDTTNEAIAAAAQLRAIDVVLAHDRSRLIQTIRQAATAASDEARRHRTERALEDTNEFLKSVLETITETVFALDLSGKFTLVNQRLIELTGFDERTLLDMDFASIFADETFFDASREIESLCDDPGERHFEGRITNRSGAPRVVACNLLPLMRDGVFVGIVGTADDITDRHRAARRIEHLAYHDPLTNLPNRRLLDDRLKIALSQALRDQRSVVLLFLDVDHFKAVNDSLGHRVGDLLLQELAARLRGCVRQGDTVARLGGDEFVFVIPALNKHDEAVSIVEKILQTVRAPFVIEAHELSVTACIGMSDFPERAPDADALMRQADIALFECKNGGRDTWRAYTSSMSFRSAERVELEMDLRRAMRDGEFKLYYQPIVNLRTGQIHATEALLRWDHPQRGLLSPDDFLELAEDTGMIVALGEWSIHQAVAQNARWQRAGFGSITSAVNISARQFSGPIVNTVRSALRSARLEPKYLSIELSERTLVQNISSPNGEIAELQSLGVGLTIDDFGTGYSSLGYLERFPIDTIKIDRSFMPVDFSRPSSGSVASAILSLARGMGMHAIAEGIETTEQAEFLLSRGCTIGQGHLYYEALEAGEMEQLLRGDLEKRILA